MNFATPWNQGIAPSEAFICVCFTALLQSPKEYVILVTCVLGLQEIILVCCFGSLLWSFFL
jgi:hypothetical protein